MSRVLLVIPAETYRAGAFLAAAAAQRLEVALAVERPQALSGLAGVPEVVVDLSSPAESARAIAALAGRWPLDAVVAVDEAGLATATAARLALGLPANDPRAMDAARCKATQRRLFARAAVAQPGFRVLGPADDAAGAVRELGPPCVIKPIRLSASQGVIRVDEPSRANEVAAAVREIALDAGRPADEPLLVEGYLEGEEVVVEGIVCDGRLVVLAIMDKPDAPVGPGFEETLLVTPSRRPDSDQEAAKRLAEGAVSALGIEHGPVHIELRIARGCARIIELAARSIGGRCSGCLVFPGGRSLESLILREALGRDPDPGAAAAPGGALMMPVERAGRLRSIEGLDVARAVPGIIRIDVTASAGDWLEPPPRGGRYLGFVLARGDDAAAVEMALREAWRAIRVRFED